LDLTGTTFDTTNGCLPLPDPRWDRAIFAFQDNLFTNNPEPGCAGYPDATCGIFTSVTGTEPNRQFNIEWRAVLANDPTSPANFEVVFYENVASFFDIIYGVTGDNGASATSGVQASSAGPATTFSCGTDTLTNSLKVTYSCPEVSPTPTATFTPAPTATATFTPTATATFTPTATATATATSTPTPTPSATPIQVSQITPTGTTCADFSSGRADALSSLQYSVQNGVIHNVSPGVFFYWVKVTTPAGNNTFTITQTITTGNFTGLFDIQSGSNVFNSSCNSVHPTITQNPTTGAVTATFNAPAAGTYFISIKYSAQSLGGDPAPSPGTTVHYNFATTAVPGSTSGLDLLKQ
jgi:hypothetical protein